MPNFVSRILLFLILLSLSPTLFAQNSDSLKATNDSLIAVADSLPMGLKKERKPPVYLPPQFFNINGQMRDSLRNDIRTVYRFSEILKKNYNGLSHILRNEAEYQVYSFNEPFRPAYAAPLNLLPHQTAVSLDYHHIGNPISGLYGMQYLPLDGVCDIETSPLLSSNGANAPLQINTRLIKTGEPYTRIMYSQGDWGFSNVDITFSERFTNRLLVQLGGARRLYDGWQYNTSSVNDNYRVQIAYQFTDKIFNRFRFQKNDGMFNMFNFSDFPYYRLSDERVDIYNDLIITTDDSLKAYWRITAGVNTADRTAYFDSLRVSAKFDNYTAGIMRFYTLGSLAIQGGVSLNHSQVWGSAFTGRFPDNTIEGFLSLDYTFGGHFFIKPVINYAYLFNFNNAFSASAVLGWQNSKMNASLSYEKYERIAFRNERSSNLLNYKGNERLNNEDTHSLSASFGWMQSKYLSLTLLGGNRRLNDAILFDGSNFFNGRPRSFSYLSIKIKTQVYKFVFLGGGEVSNGNIKLSPQSSAWLQGQYHSKFYHNRITFDAVGSVYAYGSHQRVIYDPVIDRFYYNPDITDEGYWFFNYKLALTVKDIQFYFAMDNPLSSDYAYVYGYREQFRRMVFGLNWVLWN